MNTKETRNLIASEDKSILKNAPKTLHYKFSIEFFRFMGFFCLVSVVMLGTYLSNKYVFGPNGYRDIKNTRIYELLGFNHSCNMIDFNPAKEVAAIMMALVQVPLSLFIILSYFRIKLAYINGEISKGLYNYSVFIKPYCLVCMTSLHLWMVNSPEGHYPESYGFMGHYLPYMTFKIAMMLMSIEQIQYYTEMKLISVGPTFGRFYIYFIIILTLFYIACILSAVAGNPILDSKHNETDKQIFQLMLSVYDICSGFIPLIFSFIQMYNGDNNTVTFGHQGADGLPAFEKKKTEEEEEILKADIF